MNTVHRLRLCLFLSRCICQIRHWTWSSNSSVLQSSKLSFTLLAKTTPTSVENPVCGRGSRDDFSVAKLDPAPYIAVHARSINLPRVVIRATGGRPNLEVSIADIAIKDENRRLIVRINRDNVLNNPAHFITKYSESFSQNLSMYRFIEIYRNRQRAFHFRAIESAEFLFHTRLHSSQITLGNANVQNRTRTHQWRKKAISEA